jgi:7-cyano-7-deazaguanine synthase in queuosine biosynthesis
MAEQKKAEQIKAEQIKAVVLVSGGLDSVTALAMAQDQGFDCYALSVDYGQRHHSELDAAKRVTGAAGVWTCARSAVRR